MKDLFTQSAFTFYFIGIAAMALHAVKKWADGEVDGWVGNWYMKDRRRTVAALLTCGGAIASAILGGVLVDPADTVQVLACAGLGFASDSLNKVTTIQPQPPQ
jgi:hypothetical protein